MIYERKDNEIMHSPPHPGEILREECIKPLGLSVTVAALKLGMSKQTLSKILNEKMSVSSINALKLAKAFKTSPDFWLGLQMQYDLWEASQHANLDNVQVM